MVSGSLTEQNIPKMILEFSPHLIVTMGWTTETTGERVDWIYKHVNESGIPHVYWATEDPTHTERFTLPLITKMQPDFVFTICPQRVEYYENLGIKSAHMDFGFHKNVHHPTLPDERYSHDIAVVANGYYKNLLLYPKHYRIESLKTLIAPLVQENIRVDFFGWGWEDMQPFLGAGIPKEWIHGRISYTEANKVYSSAKIMLGLQNHLTQLTQRTYETLASKGFLITSDTPEVRRVFRPGRDLVVSSSLQETVELVKYYLEHEEARESIRNRGYRSVAAHSYAKKAKYMVKILLARKIMKKPNKNKRPQ